MLIKRFFSASMLHLGGECMKEDKILNIIRSHNGVISNKEALTYGISRVQLFRLKEKGLVRSLTRGLYCLNDEIPDMMYIIQNRCKKGTFSHESALYYHELTDRTPTEQVMTVPSSYNTTAMKNLPVKFRYVNPLFIELGRKKMKTSQGNEVYMYDLERTICDVIRNKSSMDASVVNFALREYARNRHSKISLLMLYAKKMGIDKKVRRTMEVLL